MRMTILCIALAAIVAIVAAALTAASASFHGWVQQYLAVSLVGAIIGRVTMH